MIVISSHDAAIIRTALILYPNALPRVSDDTASNVTAAEIDMLVEDMRRFSEDPIGISDGAEYAELTYDVAVGHQTYIEQEAIAMTRACRAALKSDKIKLDTWQADLLREGSRRLSILESMTHEQRQKVIGYDPTSIMDTVEF